MNRLEISVTQRYAWTPAPRDGVYVRSQLLLYPMSLCLLGVLLSCGGSHTRCGLGTQLLNDRCVVADAAVDAASEDAGPQLSCGEGTVEDQGQCVPAPVDAGPPAQPKRSVGSACSADGDCETGSCASTSDKLPGGYCTVLDCGPKKPCPVGSTCYAASASVSMCMAFCDKEAQCRTDDGYHCQPLVTSALNICAPSCSLTGACGSGTRCNAKKGLCELAACDPTTSTNACEADETCGPDPLKLSKSGGLCLHDCDPASPSACLATKNETCQGLATDPEHKGVCTQPVCKKNDDCPIDAACSSGVCKPPVPCSGDHACADPATTCALGKCMPKCPGAGASCADTHSDLVCAQSLTVPACLPLGSFAGGLCRSTPGDECDPISAGSQVASMVCEKGACLPDCTDGGQALCDAVGAKLICAHGVYGTPVCLAKGSYPGGPCDDAGACAQNLGNNSAVDMVCKNGRCAIDCSESAQWPGYGDALCQLVDSSLTCAEKAGSICVRACGPGPVGTCDAGYACFEHGTLPSHENACLPAGSFAGSPCRPTPGDACDQDLRGNPDADLICRLGTCILPCPNNDDTLCSGVDPALTCVESVSTGSICVRACGDGGACDTGNSCLDPGGNGHQNACLPVGSFAGSPCRSTLGNECDQDLLGDLTHDLICVGGSCGLNCAGNNDNFCAAADPTLTCAESAGNVCAPDCMGGACPGGMTCHDPGSHPEHENSCLKP